MKKSLVLPLLCLSLTLPITLSADLKHNRLTAYSVINTLRVEAGMTPFKINPRLEESAKNHARYLSINRLLEHTQDPDLPGFTGVTPGDRAFMTGYEVKSVSENFSSGQKDVFESIEGLMSAIYHRFGFLDFSKNEIGFAMTKARNGYNYVYNMGNDLLNRFCRYSIYMKEGRYYSDVCRHNGSVSVERYKETVNKVRKRHLPIVVWPSENRERVPVAFYDEIPDPLPDLKVSGYPISIQFNPYYYTKIQLQEFALFEMPGYIEVKPIRLLTRKNDPNHRLTDLQFALYPKQRLKWDTSYLAMARFTVNNRLSSKRWGFRTKPISHPLFIINAQDDRLRVIRNRTYAIYIPPTDRFPLVERLRWETIEDIEATVSKIDPNTISLTLSGLKCGKVLFSLNGGRSFKVQLDENDNINENHVYREIQGKSCVPDSIKNLPGFNVNEWGKTLEVKSDQEFWIEIDLKFVRLSDFTLLYPEGMSVQTTPITPSTVKARFSGKPGQRVTFKLSNTKSFDVELIH